MQHSYALRKEVEPNYEGNADYTILQNFNSCKHKTTRQIYTSNLYLRIEL